MLLCQFTDDIVGGRKTYGDRKQEKVANMKQESGFSSVCVALSNHIYRRTQEVCFQCRLLRFTASGLLLTLPFPPSLALLVRKGNLSREEAALPQEEVLSFLWRETRLPHCSEEGVLGLCVMLESMEVARSLLFLVESPGELGLL